MRNPRHRRQPAVREPGRGRAAAPPRPRRRRPLARVERAGLAMRRLAIIDLETGDQPVANERGDVVAVVNGELYNYRELRARLEAKGHTFRGVGDVEVVPHLYEEYGERFVEHLRGMFAIALWDDSRDAAPPRPRPLRDQAALPRRRRVKASRSRRSSRRCSRWARRRSPISRRSRTTSCSATSPGRGRGSSARGSSAPACCSCEKAAGRARSSGGVPSRASTRSRRRSRKRCGCTCAPTSRSRCCSPAASTRR